MFTNTLWLMLPLILAGIIHMFVVSKNLLSSLVIPINVKLFGANKTLRGFIVMPVAGAISVLFFSLFPSYDALISKTGQYILLGSLLGLSYTLFELPNSWLKRKLGINPGEQAKKFQWFFFILDRIDSATGCAIIYYIFTSDISSFLIIPLSVLIHPVVTVPLYFLGLKKKIL